MPAPLGFWCGPEKNEIWGLSLPFMLEGLLRSLIAGVLPAILFSGVLAADVRYAVLQYPCGQAPVFVMYILHFVLYAFCLRQSARPVFQECLLVLRQTRIP